MNAGSLPPVEERLPADPVVVVPTNMVGRYGGTLRSEGLAPETSAEAQHLMVTGFFRFSNDLSVIYPELVESYAFNDDASSFTVQLRRGLKWNDGEPFTADDVIFYFEDRVFNTDLSPVLSRIWVVDGEPMTVTKLDDYAVEFGFAGPYPAFPILHRSGAPMRPFEPKHFMEQYHIKYNPNADTEAKTAGFDNWQARYGRITAVNYGAQDPAFPMLDPWIPVRSDSRGVAFERNPYYFKVDTEGNQLPYIDDVECEFVGNLEVVVLKVLSGELSFAGLDLLLVDYPVLVEGEERGGYTVHWVYSERGADVAIAPNQIHPDPVLHDIFRDVRFRQALSVSIDRDEINELVFLGLGTPRQATVNESASFFKQEWADSYAQYDPDLANQLLDELGLDQRNAEGIRLRPDGQPMAFQIEYLPHEGPKREVVELVVRHWAEVGLRVEAHARERNFLINRLNTNTHDLSAWHSDRNLERAAYAYGAYMKLGPFGDSAVTFARAWRDWVESDGGAGAEPTEEAMDMYNAYVEWQSTLEGTPEYMAAATKVFDLTQQALYCIGVIGQAPQPVILKNNLENVFPPDLEKYWWGAANWFFASTSGWQWFFTD